MNTLAALALFAVFLILLLVMVRLSIRLGIAGVRSTIVLAVPVAALPALALSGAYLISRLGAPVTGIIAAKSEHLEIGQRGLAPRVTHRLVVTVADPDMREAFKLDPRIRFGNLTFEVNEQRFDALRDGDRIAMRELKLLGLRIARFEDEPWWDIAPGRLKGFIPPSDGELRTSSARITAVRTVRDAYVSAWFADSGQGTSHALLKQPYEEVRFQFATSSGADIATLDRVDEGSAGSMQPGMSVPVHYRDGRPREAQLAIGRRTYAARNAWTYWSEDFAVLLSAAGLLTAASLLLQRRRRLQGIVARAAPPTHRSEAKSS